MEKRFELLLSDNKVVSWTGTDGEDAARRYVDCKGGTVTAWRNSTQPEIKVLGRRSVIDGRVIL